MTNDNTEYLMNDIFLLSPWVDTKYRMPITSLQLIKYYLEDHGYNAEIIDCSYYPKDLEAVVALIGRKPTPIVGVTGYTRERFHAYDLIRKVRQRIPDAVIVVGGRHFGFLAEETLKELPEVDIVVRGEGEITFKEICDAICKEGELQNIEGISYCHNGSIIHNKDRILDDYLDKFRSYDVYEKSDLKKESALTHTKTDEFNKYFSVHATRGCPNKCVYCSLKAGKVRFRSIDKIIKEIEDKVDVLGVRNVSFVDSSLTINKKFVIELCNTIIERKLDIRWRCYSRVNIDIELLKLMRRAGLSSVEIGLESGSPKVLKAIRKNINLDQVERFCQLAHESGIMVWVFCMVSLPDETYEDAKMTISFLRKISRYITNAGLQTTRITPDASLCRMAMEKGLIDQDFNWFSPYTTPHTELTRPWDSNLPIYIEHLNVEQIEEIHREFDKIKNVKLANFSFLLKGIKYNLKGNVLKTMTPTVFAKKSLKALTIFINALKNKVAKGFVD